MIHLKLYFIHCIPVANFVLERLIIFDCHYLCITSVLVLVLHHSSVQNLLDKT